MDFFSPIVIQKKSVSSNNPFDDFDVNFLQQPQQQQLFSISNADLDFLSQNVSSSPILSPQRVERFDSEDPFELFSDEAAKSPSKTTIKKPSGLRKVTKAAALESDENEQDELEEEENIESSVGERTNTSATGFREVIVPFDKDDSAMYDFVFKPIEDGYLFKATFQYDTEKKQFKLIQNSTNRVMLMAIKRTDGMKAISLESNYMIVMFSAKHVVTPGTLHLPESGRIGKLRGNSLGSQYSLFDSGKQNKKK